MNLSKEEKEKEAIEVFKKFPNADKVFVTPCGQSFLQENRANMVAKADDVIRFNRIDFMYDLDESEDNSDEPKIPFVKVPALEKIALAEKATLEELEDLAKDETRATVVKAIEARKAILNQDQV